MSEAPATPAETAVEDLPIGTLEQLEEADIAPLEGEVFPVKQWNMSLKLRGLTHGEVNVMFEREPGGPRNAFVLATACVAPAMDEAKAAEILSKKAFTGAQIVLNRILEVSGLREGFRQE